MISSEAKHIFFELCNTYDNLYTHISIIGNNTVHHSNIVVWNVVICLSICMVLTGVT